jgi:glyoxylase I family protein
MKCKRKTNPIWREGELLGFLFRNAGHTNTRDCSRRPRGLLFSSRSMSSLSFNHVALNCHDLAAQEAFFARHFGFQRSRTFNAGKPDEFIMLKLGQVRLELFPADSAKTMHEKGGEQVIGLKHLAFDVPKLEPIIEALRADGIEPDPIVDVGRFIPGCRVVFYRDPEGNIIELIEGYRDEG